MLVPTTVLAAALEHVPQSLPRLPNWVDGLRPSPSDVKKVLADFKEERSTSDRHPSRSRAMIR